MPDYDEPLDHRALLKIIQDYSAQSYGSAGANAITDNVQAMKREGLKYYLLKPRGDEQEGRSTIQSSDLSDVVEFIQPQIIDAIIGADPVVSFEATSESDEELAAIESAFVHSKLMSDDHYIELHNAIKAALIEGTGIIHVDYEDKTTTEVERYTGLDELSFQSMQQVINPATSEISGITRNEDGTIDVSLTTRVPSGDIFIENVPSEDFVVANSHNKISLEDCPFCARLIVYSRSDLLDMGVDEEVVKGLPSYNTTTDHDRHYRAIERGRSTTLLGGQINSHSPSDLIECAISIIRIDAEGTGDAQLYQVLTDGLENPTEILDIKQIPFTPFIVGAAIMLPSDSVGVSLFQRVKQLQDTRTGLLRNVMDNLYLANNGRMEVVTTNVDMDALQVSRPGAHVPVKASGSVTPIPHTDISPHAMSMLSYLDRERASRSGVTAEGPASLPNIGGSIGSEGVDRIMTAAEKSVGLMIRNCAMTMFRPLAEKIRLLIRLNAHTAQSFYYQGAWQELRPSAWPEQRRSTIKIGLGAGDRMEKIGAYREVAGLVEKLMGMEGQTMVNENTIHTLLIDYARSLGIKQPERYFQPPSPPQPQPPDENIEAQLLMAQAQHKLAEAEVTENKIKLAAEAAEFQHKQAKVALENEIEQLKVALAKASKDAELEFKYAELEQKKVLEKQRLEVARERNKAIKQQKGTE